MLFEKDFSVKQYALLSFTLYVALAGSILLNHQELLNLFIQQICGTIILTILPGMLILKLLGIKKTKHVETVVYTVGLSIFYIMFVGLFNNVFYPSFGIQNPISLLPLMITIGVTLFILNFFIYLKKRVYFKTHESNSNVNKQTKKIKYGYLLLLIIPIITIIGTSVYNYQSNNLIILFVLLLISLLPLVSFYINGDNSFFPLVCFIAAISLLYHTSLLSNYLWGLDIHREYYLANLVILNSIWDPSIYSNANAMLSIVIFAPLYSIISDIELEGVLKIIYPLIYSLVPVGLYRIYQKQTNSEISFLSVFYFISVYSFYLEMPQLARQQIAELFLVALMLVMFDEGLNKKYKSILSIIFAFSMITSHYGISFIYLYMLIFVFCFNFVFNKYLKSDFKTQSTSLVFVILYLTLLITWYMHISSSSPFDSVVNLLHSIVGNIHTDLFDKSSSEGLNLLSSKMESPFQEITKILNLCGILFITIGLVTVTLSKQKYKINSSYLLFSIASYSLCLAAIVLPFFAAALNTTRIFHISLLFLSPFCVLGIISIFQYLVYIFRLKQIIKLEANYRFASIFFVIFLIFNSGLAYEIIDDPSGPILLGKETIIEKGTLERKASLFYTYNTFEEEVYGIKWVSINSPHETLIYSDYNRLRLHSYGMIPESRLKLISSSTNFTNLDSNSYIFMGYPNIKHDLLIYKSSRLIEEKFERILAFPINVESDLDCKNKIYSNGGSIVYK